MATKRLNMSHQHNTQHSTTGNDTTSAAHNNCQHFHGHLRRWCIKAGTIRGGLKTQRSSACNGAHFSWWMTCEWQLKCQGAVSVVGHLPYLSSASIGSTVSQPPSVVPSKFKVSSMRFEMGGSDIICQMSQVTIKRSNLRQMDWKWKEHRASYENSIKAYQTEWVYIWHMSKALVQFFMVCPHPSVEQHSNSTLGIPKTCPSISSS